MGWLGFGRYGFFHLCASDGSRVARAVAQVGNPWRPIVRRLVRRIVVCAVPRGLGMFALVGSNCRPLRSCANADAHDPLLFTFYVLWRVRGERLDVGCV